MNTLRPSPAKESRLLRRFSENMRAWGSDAAETYVSTPLRQGNPVKTVLGTGMLMASTVLEATDYALAGALNQKVDPPTAIFGRVRRDTGALIKDIVTLHPIRALLDFSRLAFSDLPLDSAEAVLGFDHGSAGRIRHESREKMRHAVA